ncbi:MAG: hypothetical protein ABSG27_08765 [Candidatus Acidiferrales bacterium]|jgi:hypothetical protein
MKRLLIFATVVALSLVASGLLMAQSNSALGTWKLNVAKSKWVNVQAPKSETRTIEAQGNGAKYTFEGVAGDGSHFAWSFTTNYDGKDSAISGAGAPNGGDTEALKRVDANTTTATTKKGGKVVQTTTAVVSNDGKVTTLTSKGTNAQGQPTSSTTVFDKQ